MNRKSEFLSICDSIKLSGGIAALVIAIRLPSGATEVITNFEDINGKIKYYDNAYDEDLHLYTNEDISIVDYMVIPKC